MWWWSLYFLFLTQATLTQATLEVKPQPLDSQGCVKTNSTIEVVSKTLKVISDDPRPHFLRTRFQFRWYDLTATLRLVWLGHPAVVQPFLPGAHTDPLESFTVQRGDLGEGDKPFLRRGAAGLPFVVRGAQIGDEFTGQASLDAVEFVPLEKIETAAPVCKGEDKQEPVFDFKIEVVAPSEDKHYYQVDLITEFMGSFRGPDGGDLSFADAFLLEQTDKAYIATGNTFGPAQMEAEVNDSELTLKFLKLRNVQAINVGLAELNLFGWEKLHLIHDDQYYPPFLSSNIYDKRTGFHAFKPYRIVQVQRAAVVLDFDDMDIDIAPSDIAPNDIAPSNVDLDNSSTDTAYDTVYSTAPIRSDYHTDDHTILSPSSRESESLRIAVFGVMGQYDAAQLNGEVLDKFEIRSDYIRPINELCVSVVAQGEADTCMLISTDGAIRDGNQVDPNTEFSKIWQTEGNFVLFTTLVGTSTGQTMNVENTYSSIVQGEPRGGLATLTYEQDVNVPQYLKCTAQLRHMKQVSKRDGNIDRLTSVNRHHQTSVTHHHHHSTIDRQRYIDINTETISDEWEAAKEVALLEASKFDSRIEGQVIGTFHHGRDIDGFNSCVEESPLAKLAADSIYFYAKQRQANLTLALIDCEAFVRDLAGDRDVTTLDLWHTVKDHSPIEIVELEGYQVRNLLRYQFAVDGLSLRNAVSVSANAAYRFEGDSIKVEDIVADGEFLRNGTMYVVATTRQISKRVYRYYMGQRVLKPTTQLEGSVVDALAAYLNSHTPDAKDYKLDRGADFGDIIAPVELEDASMSHKPRTANDLFIVDMWLRASNIADLNFYLREIDGPQPLAATVTGDRVFIRIRTKMSLHRGNEIEIWAAKKTWEDQSYSPSLGFKVHVPWILSDDASKLCQCLWFEQPALSGACLDTRRPSRWKNITAVVGTSDPQFFEWQFDTHCWTSGNGLIIQLDSFPEGLEAVPATEDFPVVFHWWPTPTDQPGVNKLRIPVSVKDMRVGEYNLNVIVSGYLYAANTQLFPVKIDIVESSKDLTSRDSKMSSESSQLSSSRLSSSSNSFPPYEAVDYKFRFIDRFNGKLMGPYDSSHYVDQSYHYDMIANPTGRFTVANGDWARPFNWVQERSGAKHLKKFSEYSGVSIFTFGVQDLKSDDLELTIRTMLSNMTVSHAHDQMLINSQVVLNPDETPDWFAVMPSVVAYIDAEDPTEDSLPVQIYAALSDNALRKVGDLTNKPSGVTWQTTDLWVPRINEDCDNLVKDEMINFCILVFHGGPDPTQNSLDEVLAGDTDFGFVLRELSSNFRLVSAGQTDRQYAWQKDGRLIIQGLSGGLEAADVTYTHNKTWPTMHRWAWEFTELKHNPDVYDDKRVQELVNILNFDQIEIDPVGGSIAAPGLLQPTGDRGQPLTDREGTVCDFIADGMLALFNTDTNINTNINTNTDTNGDGGDGRGDGDSVNGHGDSASVNGHGRSDDDSANVNYDIALIPHSYCEAEIPRPSKFASDKLAQWEVDVVLGNTDSGICSVKMLGSDILSLILKQWENDFFLATSHTLTYIYLRSTAALIRQTMEVHKQPIDLSRTYNVLVPERFESSIFSNRVCQSKKKLSDALIAASNQFPIPQQRQLDSWEILELIDVTVDHWHDDTIINIVSADDNRYTDLQVSFVNQAGQLELIGEIPSLPARELRSLTAPKHMPVNEDLTITIISKLWESNQAIEQVFWFYPLASPNGGEAVLSASLVLIVLCFIFV